MSQYTTDEVLEMMEGWYEQHKDDDGFDPDMRFKGFDGLLGADLSSVDLSSATIQRKAEEYRRGRPDEEDPPWLFYGRLDLRRAVLSTQESRAQLQGANFAGAYLDGAVFVVAQLQGANFEDAELQRAVFVVAQLRGANFMGAQLEGADFGVAQLQLAYFSGARLEGAVFRGARLQGAYFNTELAGARLEEAAWDNDYILGFELDRSFDLAESAYRQVKQYYNGSGQYGVAGEFHRRELLMRRRQLWKEGGGAWREAMVLLVSAMLMGHGERPSWVVGWVVACFAAFAAAYWLLNALPDGSLVESIRHSAQTMVSFGRREDLAKWAQDAALGQSFISYVLLALFLVTFVRKVSPR